MQRNVTPRRGELSAAFGRNQMKFGVRKNIEYRARSDKGETKKGGDRKSVV
jgi:hypothetical protein